MCIVYAHMGMSSTPCIWLCLAPTTKYKSCHRLDSVSKVFAMRAGFWQIVCIAMSTSIQIAWFASPFYIIYESVFTIPKFKSFSFIKDKMEYTIRQLLLLRSLDLMWRKWILLFGVKRCRAIANVDCPAVRNSSTTRRRCCCNFLSDHIVARIWIAMRNKINGFSIDSTKITIERYHTMNERTNEHIGQSDFLCDKFLGMNSIPKCCIL